MQKDYQTAAFCAYKEKSILHESEVLYILIQAQERPNLFPNINDPAEGHWSCGWSRPVAVLGAEFCPPSNIQKQVLDFLVKNNTRYTV